MSSTPLLPRRPDDDIGPRWAAAVGLDQLPGRGRSALLLPAFSFGLPSGRWRGLGRAGPDPRPTQDLDLFTHFGGTGVPAARDALEAAASNQGWGTEHIRDEATFCRLIIQANDNLLIDLALDSPPGQPATASLIGPTFAREELADRKVLALFDRAEARDFADVFELSEHFAKDDLLDQAALVDPGFDERVFAQMLRRLARFSDQDLPAPETRIPAIRGFFASWAEVLKP